ncbi:MAG: heavy-metal-associated domain-containing protein [Bacteroidia bacterium]
MRTIFILMICIFAGQLRSQTGIKTATFSVKGNCEQCKARIENAADIKGVKLCVWDEVSQAATVTYNPDKVTLEQIEQAVAKSGHDTGIGKSKEADYKKLPDCCKYRDKKCEKK